MSDDDSSHSHSAIATTRRYKPRRPAKPSSTTTTNINNINNNSDFSFRFDGFHNTPTTGMTQVNTNNSVAPPLPSRSESVVTRANNATPPLITSPASSLPGMMIHNTTTQNNNNNNSLQFTIPASTTTTMTTTTAATSGPLSLQQQQYMNQLTQQKNTIHMLNGQLMSRNERVQLLEVSVQSLETAYTQEKRNREQLENKVNELRSANEQLEKKVRELQASTSSSEVQSNAMDQLASMLTSSSMDQISFERLEQMHTRMSELQQRVMSVMSQKVQNISMCDICFEHERDTRLDPCGHVFCSHCIRNTTGGRCPKCRDTYRKAQTIYF